MDGRLTRSITTDILSALREAPSCRGRVIGSAPDGRLSRPFRSKDSQRNFERINFKGKESHDSVWNEGKLSSFPKEWRP
jgi:hypothetical protein